MRVNKPYLILAIDGRSKYLCREGSGKLLRFETEAAAAEMAGTLANCCSATFTVILDKKAGG